MSTTHSMKLLALTALLVTIINGPTFAETYLIQDGEDTSPYSFIPALPRHTSPTLYAYTAEPDENNLSHNFEAYIRFTIPAKQPAQPARPTHQPHPKTPHAPAAILQQL